MNKKFLGSLIIILFIITLLLALSIITLGSITSSNNLSGAINIDDLKNYDADKYPALSYPSYVCGNPCIISMIIS